MAAQKGLTTYIALFHDRDTAASAVRDLEASGFTQGAITVIGGSKDNTYTHETSGLGEGYRYGDQSSLTQIGVPEEDRDHLQNVLRHGGVVLALEGAGERADEIEKIFSRHSTKKIDEKNVEDTPLVDPYAAPVESLNETVIPITQEELVVGKRTVDQGGVRVFRHVVDMPAVASVNLHEEHVVVERRPIDRMATAADLASGDRVIELTETAEEAVVSKTAHVVEEVIVSKQVSQHTEHIADTVRRTEVDVKEIPSTERIIADRTF